MGNKVKEGFFIAIDGIGWCRDVDFREAIRKREEDSGQRFTMNVFWIPGKVRKVGIEWFIPQIEGATLVYSQDNTRTDDREHWDYGFYNQEVQYSEKNERYSLK